MSRPRVAIAGWGIVAPRCPNVDSFEGELERGESWLRPFAGFGKARPLPDNFLVGQPDFELSHYREWIDRRFPPRRYSQIESKLGKPAHYALGAFIQALAQNQGVEQWLRELGNRAHVYLGTGIGDIETIRSASLELEAAQQRWDAFWDGREQELADYLARLREIEGEDVSGDLESGKRSTIRRKQTLRRRLQKEVGAPDPPWSQVSANLLWNIHNGPASQVSMLGGITGPAFAPVAACSSFGWSLKLAVDAIRAREAVAVVVGATDPPPHPLVVGGFFQGRVISADGAVSKPLTGLRGTHVAGGAAVWIVADYQAMRERGFEPLGAEPIGLGASSDADHVITPSIAGPLEAVRAALADAAVEPDEIDTWDLHATATPGDVTEVETLRQVLPDTVWLTARKGTFGHGMSVGGGWELTAQHLGLQRGVVFPTPLDDDEIHPQIRQLHRRIVTRTAGPESVAVGGKLSMGVGGINACVISRRFQD